MIKKEIRDIYLQKRRFMERNIVMLFSQKIKENLNTQFDFNGKNVSLYTSMDEQNEVQTKGLIDFNIANVYAPVMMPKRELIHVRADENTIWKKNEWEILEPSKNGESLAPDLFNFVIVPLLVADKKGYRVGYGGGYYDRFLAKCSASCVFIGVGFFDLIDSIEDVDEFDIPLHYYISPNNTVKF